MIFRVASSALALALASAITLSSHPLFAQEVQDPPASTPQATAPPPSTPAPVATTAPTPIAAKTDRDDAYVGSAAPPTSAGTTAHTANVHPGLEVFAQYAYRLTTDQNGSKSWFHDFDITRAHASLDGEYDGVRGRLLIEAVRSASNGALVGVAGDSLVFRAREAYASYRFVDEIDVSAGIIPTLTIGELDGTWRMRAITASPMEAYSLESPADVGVNARVNLPQKYGWAAIAWYNGEGYTEPELNRGKTFEAAAEFHPSPSGDLLPLALFASYENGSTGTELARANRFTGGIFWQGARVRAGIDFVHAWGIADVGTDEGSIVDAFVRLEPIDRFLLGARAEYFTRTSATGAADAITTIYGTIGARIADPLEAFFAVTRSIPTAQADTETPGSDFWELRLISRIVF